MKTAIDLQNVPNPADQRDIIELQERIAKLKSGKEHEERFKHYRLTRGVYGQRQVGVQMFRTKIPYGKLTADQLDAIANAAEKYTNGNLHLTTRQNIQLHFVRLDDSPKIWTELAETGVNAREACGNTVRNITASANAGIDPAEPFDVTPYVHAMYEYFLRNPICQDMGRKIKIAFSSSAEDSAYTYFHDFGFIPQIKTENGREVRGFKVVIGGGLGAQSIVAPVAFEFLLVDQILPFTDAAIRLFDRYGEREKRFKARMKFLVKDLGVEKFLVMIDEERKALERQSIPIEPEDFNVYPTHGTNGVHHEIIDQKAYDLWQRTNVFEQKQKGWCAVQVKVRLGNIDAEQARAISTLVRHYASDDIRITVNQGLLFRFIRPEHLPAVFNGLYALGFADAGFGSITDVTACPGTDTCNLGVTNSTALAVELERVVAAEYPQLIEGRHIQIKISGCMNSCGQHMAADIGFHGSSIKVEGRVAPAMQIVLGGGVTVDGEGYIADKVIKLPTRRIPQALRDTLDEFLRNQQDGETFKVYYQRTGKRHFYDILKPLGDTSDISEEEFADWGQKTDYVQAIGVGECAGVSYDQVSAIIQDAHDKVVVSEEAFNDGAFGDSIYHSYSAFVIGAKGLLLAKDVKCNTHIGIINDFQEHFASENTFGLPENFDQYVLRMKQQAPTSEFAKDYLQRASAFLKEVNRLRAEQLAEEKDRQVVSAYYKA